MENPQDVKKFKEELEKPIFSEERYKYFRESGLTEEEIQVLERAEAAANLTELVPDDVKSVFDKIESLPDDKDEAMKYFDTLRAEKPEEYAQIIALVNMNDMAFEGEGAENGKN